MKYYKLIMLVMLVTGLLLTSCDESSDPVEPEDNMGKLAVFSTPAGAKIYLDGTDTYLLTPDTVEAEAGLYNLRLEAEDYQDTTFSISISADQVGVVNISLQEDRELTFYGEVTIYETLNSTVNQPSGIDLSTGVAQGIAESNNERNTIDVYYSSNEGRIVRSAHLVQQIDPLYRNTYFFVGSSSDLDDGVNSPMQDASWEDGMDDDENNYTFLYDDDGHYSKLRIIERGTANNGVQWLKVEWWFNEKIDNRNF